MKRTSTWVMRYRVREESGNWGSWRTRTSDLTDLGNWGSWRTRTSDLTDLNHATSPAKLVAHETLGMKIRTFQHRQGAWTWEVIPFGGSMVQFRFNTSARDALAETILAKQFEKNEKDKDYDVTKRSQ